MCLAMDSMVVVLRQELHASALAGALQGIVEAL